MKTDDIREWLVEQARNRGQASTASQWKRRQKRQITEGVLRAFEHPHWGWVEVLETPEGLARWGVTTDPDLPNDGTEAQDPSLLWTSEERQGARGLIEALIEAWRQAEIDENENDLGPSEQVLACPDYARYGGALPGWVRVIWEADSPVLSTRRDLWSSPAHALTLRLCETVIHDPELEISSLLQPWLPSDLEEAGENVWRLDPDSSQTVGEMSLELAQLGFVFEDQGSSPSLISADEVQRHLKATMTADRPSMSAILRAFDHEDEAVLEQWTKTGWIRPSQKAWAPGPSSVYSWWDWCLLSGRPKAFEALLRGVQPIRATERNTLVALFQNAKMPPSVTDLFLTALETFPKIQENSADSLRCS